jgi:hypothetical protein
MGFKATGLDYSKWAANYCSQLGFEIRQGSLLGQWPEAEFETRGPINVSATQLRLCPPKLLRDAWPIWCLDSHLWQFTARQICKLVRQTGFQTFTCRTLHGYTPDSWVKRKLLDCAAIYGFADGCNIIAIKS